MIYRADRLINDLREAVAAAGLSVCVEDLDSKERALRYAKYLKLQPWWVKQLPYALTAAIIVSLINLIQLGNARDRVELEAARYRAGYVEELEGYYYMCQKIIKDSNELEKEVIGCKKNLDQRK